MNDKLCLKLLEYWRDNPEKITELPEELKDKITEEEKVNLIAEVGELTPPSIFSHIERLRKKIKEDEEIRTDSNTIQEKNPEAIDYSDIKKITDTLSSTESRALRYVSSNYSNKVLNHLKDTHREKINSLCDFYGYNKEVLVKYEKLNQEALKLSLKDLRSLRYESSISQNKNLLKYLTIHRNELIKFYFQSDTSKIKIETTKESEAEGKTYAVFLSHSQKDKLLANKIKSLLNEMDVISFVAHDDIEEGEVWEPTIIERVKNSKIIIVLGTTDIENSAWVNFETGIGYDKMFPVLFNKLTDKVSYIKNKQGIIIDYNEVDKSILKFVYTVISKLGLTTKKSDDAIRSLEYFKELKDYILENYK